MFVYLIFKIVDSIFDGFVNTAFNLGIVLVFMFFAFANFNYIGFPFGVFTAVVDLEGVDIEFAISLIAIFLFLIVFYGVRFIIDLLKFLNLRNAPEECTNIVWGGFSDNFDEIEREHYKKSGRKKKSKK